jgi:hypothetical protein
MISNAGIKICIKKGKESVSSHFCNLFLRRQRQEDLEFEACPYSL